MFEIKLPQRNTDSFFGRIDLLLYTFYWELFDQLQHSPICQRLMIITNGRSVMWNVIWNVSLAKGRVHAQVSKDKWWSGYFLAPLLHGRSALGHHALFNMQLKGAVSKKGLCWTQHRKIGQVYYNLLKLRTEYHNNSHYESEFALLEIIDGLITFPFTNGKNIYKLHKACYQPLKWFLSYCKLPSNVYCGKEKQLRNINRPCKDFKTNLYLHFELCAKTSINISALSSYSHENWYQQSVVFLMETSTRLK